MTRDEIYAEMTAMLGLVPTFMTHLPDSSLELEWQLFKVVQATPGALDNKTRELIGLGIAAITKCRYCQYYHMAFAKLFGATDAEIEDALHFAKSSAGWSTYITGFGCDYEQFRQEVDGACRHLQAQMAG